MIFWRRKKIHIENSLLLKYTSRFRHEQTTKITLSICFNKF